MKNKVLIKKNDSIEIIPRSLSTEQAFSNLKQLCWQCDDSRRNECHYIHDVHKLTIDKYDFIKDGLQLFGAFGKPISLMVCKCDNFMDKSINEKHAAKVLKR